MEKRITVDTKYLPLRMPIVLTWLSALSQRVWDMPGWLVGVMWTMVIFVWLIWAVDTWNRESRSPFTGNRSD